MSGQKFCSQAGLLPCSTCALYFLALFGAGFEAASLAAGCFFGVASGGSHADLALGTALGFRAAAFAGAFGITVLRSQQDAIVCRQNRKMYILFEWFRNRWYLKTDLL